MKRFIETITDERLRPCPFCGTTPAKSIMEARKLYIQIYEASAYNIGEPQKYAIVKCGGCGAQLSRATAEYAVNAWNKRTTNTQED